MMMSSSRGLSPLFQRARDTATWHRLGDTTLVLGMYMKRPTLANKGSRKRVPHKLMLKTW